MIKLSDLPQGFSRLKKIAINRLQLRQVFGVIITSLLAFGLAAYLQWPASEWIIISALLGFYFSMRLVMQRQFILFVTVACVTGLLAFATSQLAGHLYALAFFLLFLTCTMVYLGLRQASLWAATFVASFYAILSAGLATNFSGGVERLYCIGLGFTIAIIVQMIFTRGRLKTDINLVIANSLSRLAKLSHAIFRSYVTHNYAEEHFNYEKKLHQCRSSFLDSINQARSLLSKMSGGEQKRFSLLLVDVEQIYEILQSLSLLIYRVDDHSTFTVADKEFLAISAGIDAHLRQLVKAMHAKKKEPSPSSGLSENIYELEEMNRTILQVVASDPLVFMIFIQDLYALDKMIARLSQAITQPDENDLVSDAEVS